jgi:hypothetical protein
MNLYSFHWYCGWSGNLHGLFLATETEVKEAIGRLVNFGEVLGEHSKVTGILEEDEIVLITDDQEFIVKLYKLFRKNKTLCGYNPLEYIVEHDVLY